MGKNFLNEDGTLFKRTGKTKTFTTPLKRKEIPIDYYTDEELHAAKGGVHVYDLEIYPNYFLAAFKNYQTGKVVTFELFPGRTVFNHAKLLFCLHNFCTVGFNSRKFDDPLIWLAMTGATPDMLHDACLSIIEGNAMPRDIEYQYNFKMSKINTIDLIEVAPLSASLKTYAGRLHAPRLQDLPYDPGRNLTSEQAEEVKLYCINDLDLTALLLNKLSPQLELRLAMGKTYGLDLRSKSDAQIAETVICSEVAKINGAWPKRPKIMPGTSFKYKVPDFVKYQTPVLQEMLEIVRNADFIIQANGKVEKPPSFKSIEVLRIGSSVYKMGIGGLHSSESMVCYKEDENNLIKDVDATSFYPAAIRGQELYPKHIGCDFLNVYGLVVDQRIAAKKLVSQLKKDKIEGIELINATTEMNSKKTVILSSFGKFGSKWSSLYAPDLMIQVTLSGQLAILMVIEAIELAGIPVVSGNTDGIVILCPRNRYEDLQQIIKWWEDVANFQTEETSYKSIYISSVSNYIALKTNDEFKLKGFYGNPGLQKNPTSTICSEALTELIKNNIPIEHTVRNCTDITKFVTVRNVRGGAEKNRVYLGKVVRWYYAEKEKGCINYINSGNKVPKSDGAKPLMDLPETFPTDINYDRYIEDTVDMLYDIAYLKKPTQLKFF